jgi:hypothetical protein
VIWHSKRSIIQRFFPLETFQKWHLKKKKPGQFLFCFDHAVAWDSSRTGPANIPHATVGSLLKVTGHPFWRFAENRYCALNISPIFITFSPNILQCMQNMVKL